MKVKGYERIQIPSPFQLSTGPCAVVPDRRCDALRKTNPCRNLDHRHPRDQLETGSHEGFRNSNLSWHLEKSWKSYQHTHTNSRPENSEVVGSSSISQQILFACLPYYSLLHSFGTTATLSRIRLLTHPNPFRGSM